MDTFYRYALNVWQAARCLSVEADEHRGMDLRLQCGNRKLYKAFKNEVSLTHISTKRRNI